MELRRYLLNPYESHCHRCGQTVFTPISGFIHDIRCFGWVTAIHNEWMVIQAALGLIDGIAENEYD